MPYKTAHPCAYPSCPNLAHHGQRFCAAHAIPEQPRPSLQDRGYPANWKQIRKSFLSRHPTCEQVIETYLHEQEVCGQRATVPHHIIPIIDGGSSDEANLLAMCAQCHSRAEMILKNQARGYRGSQGMGEGKN